MAKKSIIIMKIGGSCLRDAAAFEKVASIVNEYRADHELVIVASALSKITDLLLETARKAARKENYRDLLDEIKKRHESVIMAILKDYHMPVLEYIEEGIKSVQERLEDCEEYGLSNAKLDHIMAHGEILSTFILSSYLKYRGIHAMYLPANKFLVTDDIYNDALPIFDITKKMVDLKVKPVLEKKITPVITGFIARNKEGHMTTLGRGGSDFTATILARCLKEEDNDVRVILWKDVSGVMTVSPKFEPRAKVIDKITYAEAKELAYFGAKLLHPRCIYAVEDLKIPIEIRNFERDKSEYTLITDSRE
ncbi:MAG: aspartate kinase, partial [Candidatus Helarchaeales archaeon]